MTLQTDEDGVSQYPHIFFEKWGDNNYGKYSNLRVAGKMGAAEGCA